MPHINSSWLALRRKRLGYEQKQIALLLGHKSTQQISRYETGQRIPSLNEAIKLSILYDLPLKVLFDRCFSRCREELERSIRDLNLAAKINLKNEDSAYFCAYLRILNSPEISEKDSDEVRHHIKVLVEERSKKILGN